MISSVDVFCLPLPHAEDTKTVGKLQRRSSKAQNTSKIGKLNSDQIKYAVVSFGVVVALIVGLLAVQSQSHDTSPATMSADHVTSFGEYRFRERNILPDDGTTLIPPAIERGKRY